MATFFVAGFIGGAIRGLVGLMKYSMAYKDVDVRPWYFIGMVTASGIIGATAAWTVESLDLSIAGILTISPAFALIVGYAGGDFLENIFKMVTTKPTLFI